MHTQQQATPTVQAGQIANLIDRTNNGYSTFAQAFIQVIKSHHVPENEIVKLFRDARDMNNTGLVTAWLTRQ